MTFTFNIGDEVWFIDQYGNLCHGIVENKTYPTTLLYPTYTAQDALFITIDSHERPDDPCDAF